jgi:membrane protein implicated in regulation of membrane protease activity
MLHSLYIFATIFGVGVTAVDLLGLLGHDQMADHGGGDDGGDGDHGDAAHDDGDHSHGDHSGSGGALLSVLRYLRTAVYFALGFGPAGLVAEATGSAALPALLWAAPAGVAAAFLARLLFRFQTKDMDSSVREEDLMFESARVIVPISHRDMGKVRARIGPVVVERYALATNADDAFGTGDVVQIVRVTDDCVYVQREEDSLPDEPSSHDRLPG